MTARSTWVGLAALTVGLSLTWAVHRAVADGERAMFQRDLDHRAGEVATYLGRRFARYEQILRSGAVLFAIKETVTRHDWQVFVEDLHLEQQYPGTLGVGYAVWLKPDEVQRHVESVRREGFADYDLRPAGPRGVYTSIAFLEPFNDRNRRAFGYDMYTEGTRRAAMRRAAESGVPTLSGRVTLLQEMPADRQSGVLLYFPVYGGEAAEPARRALRGFVYSPLRMTDLIDGVLGESFSDVSLRIYDGSDPVSQDLLYESPRVADAAADAPTASLTMPLAGRTWTLEVAPAAGWPPPPGRAGIALYAGCIITTLLAALLWGLISGRERAHRLAAHMSRAYRDAQRMQRAILDSVADGVLTVDADGRVASANPAAETIFGAEESLLVGVPVTELIPDHPRLSESSADALFSERQGRAADGRRFPIELSISMLEGLGERSGFVESVRDITERKRAEDYVRHLAHHDALTELPNRALFKDRLDAAIAQARMDNRSVGVIMVDLDHFKRINDSLGHHVGDDLLVQITARLRSCVRDTDTVARMGGDEFVVVLPGLPGAEDAVRVARLIVDAVARPVHVPGHELHVTPSVGVCLYPQDGRDSMTLLKNADTAMYHAKEQGRNRYSLFSSEMVKLSEGRMRLETDLRRAIAEGRLQTWLQPIVTADSGRVSGMEALLRWPAGDGFVSPDEFVPVAEDAGLIARIGEDMLASACRHALDVGLALGRPMQLAVNVSPQQFHHQDLAASIRSTLEATGFPAAWLTVEITERVLVRDPVEAAQTLEQMRALGVGVAIDDFGTGYSSLAYISKFPLNKLKIDRSFVRDLGTDSADTAVINAVIAMGHSLGLTIVAEGVETATQLEHLRRQGCDEVQGFLFSAAVPASDFVAAVRRLETRERARPQPAPAHEVF